AAKASLDAALQNIPPDVSATATGLSLAVNTASSGKVLDFAPTSRTVGLVMLDFDGANGAQLALSGTLSLSASSFVQLEGTASFTKKTIDASAAVADLTSASLVTLSVSGASIFAGLGGSLDVNGHVVQGATGFYATGLNFDLAQLRP